MGREPRDRQAIRAHTMYAALLYVFAVPAAYVIPTVSHSAGLLRGHIQKGPLNGWKVWGVGGSPKSLHGKNKNRSMSGQQSDDIRPKHRKAKQS